MKTTQTGHENARNSPQKKSAPTRKSRRSKLSGFLFKTRRVFLVLLGLLVLTALAQLFFGTPKEEDASVYVSEATFFEGIRVNGRDVSGLTYPAARELLLTDVEAKARSINITVKHGVSLWLLTAPDLGLTSDLDAVLLEAIKLGRSDSFVNNKAAQSELMESGRDFSTTLYPSDEALFGVLSAVASAINTEPMEPHAEPNAWTEEPDFTFHEGKNGYLLDIPALSEEISGQIKAGNYTAVLDPELVLTKPQHDMAWLKANTQLRASFQTEYGSSSSLKAPGRRGNIRKAANILNGAVLQAGETLDFNEYIGPRTEKGGWPLAPGIVNGNTYEMQAGGGICQVSTTLYNALLRCGPEMTIVERNKHSWPSSYADYGLDATVSTGGKNLVFTNSTGGPIYIFAYADDERYTMTIYIYGIPLPEGVTYQARGVTKEVVEPEEALVTENPAWPTGFSYQEITARKGYIAVAYRDKLVNGQVAETEELYTDRYRPVQGKKTVGSGPSSLPKPVIPK